MDGASLATVETAALTQGVAFLYGQAGELLRRRRQARDHARDQPAGATEALPSLRLPEDSFERAAGEPAAIPEILDKLAESLFQARRDVEGYIVGTADFGSGPEEGLEAADRLRHLIEDIYTAAVTFRGERRESGLSSASVMGPPAEGFCHGHGTTPVAS